MSCRFFAIVSLGVLCVSLVGSSPAAAGELWKLLTGRHHGKSFGAVDRPTPTGVVLAAPPYQAGSDIAWAADGCGNAVAAFRWGYFGAKPQPACTAHSGYYGDSCQWTSRRGD